MSGKFDWNDASRELVDDGRRRIEPPTIESVELLYRGELSDQAADRVREQLAYYPEIAAAMTDEQLAADLAAIDAQERHAAAAAAVFPERRLATRTFAIAASLIVVLALGGIYWTTRDRPGLRPVLTRVIDADGRRGGLATRDGGGQTPIQLSVATDYLLKPVFRPQRQYSAYRLELVDLDSSPPRLVWKTDGVQREPDGTFPAELPTADLEPALYELVLYGIAAGEAERLATYTIRFYAP